MSDLVEFLRARLDEDEIAAKAAQESAEGGEWAMDGAGPVHAGVGSTLVDAGTPYINRHIARHDPARVLREVEAKRRLLDLHAPGEMEYVDGDVCMTCDIRSDGPQYPCQTLRLLAEVYSDHPDYRQEWKPGIPRDL